MQCTFFSGRGVQYSALTMDGVDSGHAGCRVQVNAHAHMRMLDNCRMWAGLIAIA